MIKQKTMSSPKRKRAKKSKPKYEEDMVPSNANPEMNHRVLYDIRKVVELLHHGSPLRNHIEASVNKSNKGGEPSKKDEKELSQAKRELFNSWYGLERVFGDLEDNRLHPFGWDKLAVVCSSKGGPSGGIVGKDFK